MESRSSQDGSAAPREEELWLELCDCDTNAAFVTGRMERRLSRELMGNFMVVVELK
jgi:hypothetical protein